MLKHTKILIVIALLLSLVPIYMAKTSMVYSEYCLSEYWYTEAPVCRLDLANTFI